jgi:putative PEP-CTERM system TPR-repeat lipoprotein
MLAVLAVSCGQSNDPVALIAKAQAYSKKGDYPAAIIELRNVLQLNPENGEARYLLGTAYLESGDAAFATVELQKALESGYDGKLVLPELAKSLIAQDKLKEAIDATDPTTVPSAQGSPEILNIRAYAQMLMRQPAAAKASLDLAMVLRPDFRGRDGVAGATRAAGRQSRRATALIDSAVAVAPENVDALLFRGGLQRQGGQIAEARASYRKALQINPRSVSARLDLASLEIEAKHYDDAATELEAVRQIAPRNVMGVYFKALLELRTGNNKAALQSIYKALELAPKHVPSTLLGGIAELALGNPDRAQKYLNAALEIDSRNLYGRKMLAATQLQRGQAAQAIVTLGPVLDSGPGASDAAVLALAGEAYMQNRQYAKATQYFERAAALDPKNASTRIGLGMSRLATGATDRAVGDLEAAAALGKGGARADIVLAMLNIKRKEYDQALKTIDKLEKATPSNPMFYNLKAAAYVGKGDTAQARAQFAKALQADPTFFRRLRTSRCSTCRQATSPRRDGATKQCCRRTRIRCRRCWGSPTSRAASAARRRRRRNGSSGREPPTPKRGRRSRPKSISTGAAVSSTRRSPSQWSRRKSGRVIPKHWKWSGSSWSRWGTSRTPCRSTATGPCCCRISPRHSMTLPPCR